VEDFEDLASAVALEGVLESGELLLPLDAKEHLETLLVLHKVRNGKIMIEDPLPLLLCLGVEARNGGLKKSWDKIEGTTLQAVNELAGIVVRPRALTRIGAGWGGPRSRTSD